MSNPNESQKPDPASERTAYYPASPAIEKSVEQLKAENFVPPASSEAFPAQPLGPPSLEGISSPVPSTLVPRPSGRNWVLIGGVAALALLAAGLGGGWWYLNRDNKVVVQDKPNKPNKLETGVTDKGVSGKTNETDKSHELPKATTPITSVALSPAMEAVQKLEGNSLDAIDPFDTTQPLGKLWSDLRSGGLSPADEKALHAWAAQRLPTVASPRVKAALYRINSWFDLAIPDIQPTQDESNGSSSPNPEGGTKLGGPLEIILSTLSFPRITVTASGWLQPGQGDSGLEELLSKPKGPNDTELNETDNIIWDSCVQDIKATKSNTATRIHAAFNLVNKCREYHRQDQADKLVSWAIALADKDSANLSDKLRREVERQRLALLQQRFELVNDRVKRQEVSIRRLAKEANGPQLTAAGLKSELEEIDALRRLKELSPDGLGDSPADADKKKEYDLKWQWLSKAYDELNAQVTNAADPNIPLPAPDAQRVRVELQKLRERLLILLVAHAKLQVAPVLSMVSDRAARQEQLTALQQQLAKLKEIGVDEARLAPLDAQAATLRAYLADPAPLTPDRGTKAVVDMQRLLQDTTQLQIATSVQSQLKFPKAGLQDLLKRLDLTEAHLKELQPSETDPNDPSVRLWTQLNKDVAWVTEKGSHPTPLSSDDFAELSAKLGGIVYATVQLQTQSQIARLPRTGGGPGGLDAATLRRIADLERKGAAAEQRIDRALTDAAQRAVRTDTQIQTLHEEIRDGLNKPRALAADQIQALSDQITRQVLNKLSESGYPPPPQPTVPPAKPTGDPELARGYAAPAYHNYNDGCPEQLAKALTQFNQAARIDPDNATYRYFLALVLYRLGRVPEAEAQAQAGRLIERQRPSHQVDLALERVQGPLRFWLEEIRRGS